MASEGEPTNDDSFTQQQLEVIRELIVANRPPPSAEAPTAHRRPRPPARPLVPAEPTVSPWLLGVIKRMHGEAGLGVIFRQADTTRRDIWPHAPAVVHPRHAGRDDGLTPELCGRARARGKPAR